MFQYRCLCYYINGTQHFWQVDRYYYNREEFVRYDSNVGEHRAVTDWGRSWAEDFNSQKDFMERKRAEVETVCRHNYEKTEVPTSLRRLGEHRISPAGGGGPEDCGPEGTQQPGFPAGGAATASSLPAPHHIAPSWGVSLLPHLCPLPCAAYVPL